MQHLALVALVLLAGNIWSPPCLAWGEAGHATVAEIAGAYLSKKARAGVRELLGPGAHQMEAVANWADEITEERPATVAWHVVEIPHDGIRYDGVRDCGNDDCVVAKVSELARVVGDRRRPVSERSEALKFLIHLVGDLHVPLHAYAPLSSSEDTWVRIGGIVEDLHWWWDRGWWNVAFEHEFGTEPRTVAATMVAQITGAQREEWMAGTPEAWANESFRLAREFVMAHDLVEEVRQGNNSREIPMILARSVLDNEIKPTVVQRLKMAGVRLAWLLNEAFR